MVEVATPNGTNNQPRERIKTNRGSEGGRTLGTSPRSNFHARSYGFRIGRSAHDAQKRGVLQQIVHAIES
jgi:hypothetical protein